MPAEPMPEDTGQETRPGGGGSLTWLWILIGAALLTQTSLNLVRPLVSYKVIALGGDAAAVGLVAAVYAMLPVVAALWLGRLSDRRSSLTGLVVAGALLLAAAAVFLALAPDLLWLGAASVVLGMGHLVFTIAGQSAIARYAPVGHLDAGFGWFTAAFSGGQLLGPLLAGLLLGHGLESSGSARMAAINSALFLAAGIAAAAVPLMFAYRPGPRRTLDGQPAAGNATAAPPVETALQILRRPGVAWNMLAAMALLATIDILVAFLPLLAEERGVAPLVVGTLLAVRACASIVSRLMISQLLQRFSRYQLLIASLLGAGAALLFTPLLLENFWAAAVSLAIGGLLLGLGQPLTMSLITQAVLPQSRGAALALRLLGNRVGQVVFPLAAGLLAAPLGPAGAIWFACLVLGGAGAAKLVHRR
ncbi:MFS transporter [Arthrobacter sp. I2-34]|uniref:MFS transporter n=1 Tax=Arthrobacter hankyongi TaxID=2904801 RepID=A0ABS9L5F4_9MICC|nr:MFS transporter [Arthrobacter hankyongi]MCG2621893.1 MFS transporter [Arthrobacter hankyongi]